MDLILIRHGEINSNLRKVYSGRSDEPLNPQGLTQAEAASIALDGTALGTVYSSPLLRTRQTAEKIAARHHTPIILCDAFTEIDMGPWEGMAENEVEQAYPKEWALWNCNPAELAMPGRERLSDLRDRALEGLRLIQSREPNVLTHVIVSHVAVLRVLLLHMRKMDLNLYKEIHIPNATPERIRIHDLTFTQAD